MKEIIKDFKLYDVELRHDIVVPGYNGQTTHILVFIDKKAMTYYWVTSCFPSEYTVGKIYNLRARHETDTNRLSYVKIIDLKPTPETASSKSEQVSKPNAEDVLLGLATYTK